MDGWKYRLGSAVECVLKHLPLHVQTHAGHCGRAFVKDLLLTVVSQQWHLQAPNALARLLGWLCPSKQVALLGFPAPGRIWKGLVTRYVLFPSS